MIKLCTFRYSMIGSVILLALSSAAHALVISDEVFQKNNGSLSDIKGTIDKAYAPLAKKSYSYPFLNVGNIRTSSSFCSASWLGEDEKNTYILTAAHCVENGKDLTIRWHGQFYNWNNEMVAREGEVHIHPYRLNRPEGHGGASTDVAVIVAQKVKPMLDDRKQPAQQPWLYDGTSELNQVVDFVGYGVWGIRKTGAQASLSPAFAQRRAWGQNYINGIWEADHGIGASFFPEKDPKAWTNVGSGDSGSAWWQKQQGFHTIIAVTNGGNANSSTGARISKYIDWIKSIYPHAQTLQEKTTITAISGVTLPDFSRELTAGSVAYTVPSQYGISGPEEIINENSTGISRITVALEHQGDQQEYDVVLRAWRETGCEQTAMNNAFTCDGGASRLIIRYFEEDNLQLPAGTYRGAFKLEAQGWEESSYRNSLTLQTDIEKQSVPEVHPVVTVTRSDINAVATSNWGFGYQVTASSNQDDVTWKWEWLEGNKNIYLKSYDKASAEIVVPKGVADTFTKFKVSASKEGKAGESIVTINVIKPAVVIEGISEISAGNPARVTAKANFDQAHYTWTLKKNGQNVPGGIDASGELSQHLPAGDYIAEVIAASEKGARQATAHHAIKIVEQAQNSDQMFINGLKMAVQSAESSDSVTFTADVTSASAVASAPGYIWTLPSGAMAENNSQARQRFTMKKAEQQQKVMLLVRVTAGKETRELEQEITVPAATESGQIPLYKPGSAYVAGQVVKNRNGDLFECKPWPYTGWCNSTSAFHYEPGIGINWRDAWNMHK